MEAAVLVLLAEITGSGDLSYVQYNSFPLIDLQDDGPSAPGWISRSSSEGHCRNLVTPVWQARSPKYTETCVRHWSTG